MSDKLDDAAWGHKHRNKEENKKKKKLFSFYTVSPLGTRKPQEMVVQNHCSFCKQSKWLNRLRKEKNGGYFQSFTHLSWLADATTPVALDTAKAAIRPSCAGSIMVLFSFMSQISSDCTNLTASIYSQFIGSITTQLLQTINTTTSIYGQWCSTLWASPFVVLKKIKWQKMRQCACTKMDQQIKHFDFDNTNITLAEGRLEL